MSNFQRVMVAHPTLCWTPGRLRSKEDGSVITDENEEFVVKPDQYFEISENTLDACTDLTQLAELHSSLILHHLKIRYLEDEIYTYIGPMVVAINPFRKLDNINGPATIPDYLEKPRDELQPHLYSIGNKAYKAMTAFKQSQSVIISGESGSGKTESTKIVLKFLTVASGAAASSSVGFDIAEMILATNPILEAFGNAKTTRNNNSSRFGKFIKISFNGNQICGAQIDNYLLEKTRIVHQAPTERNYHVFYGLIAGTTDEEKVKYKLNASAADYNYLTNGVVDIPLDDKEWFHELRNAFQVLAFTEEEIDSIFKILSGILLIGNIEFVGTEAATIKDEKVLDELVELWDLLKGLAKSSLEERQFSAGTRGTSYKVKLTYKQAIENRDALAKAVYYNLFDWLVKKLNKQLVGALPEERFIGVLDIYGFEIFEENSLEQFCINYANEKLHQQFNQNMFKAEQEEYTKEGVPWTEINWKDNQLCIDMIEKKMGGMITLLDEEGKVPKGTDEGFLQRLDRQHSRNAYYKHLPRDKDLFSVGHFAGIVKYRITNFLEKNKDSLNADLIAAMKTSKLPLMRAVWEIDSTSRAPHLPLIHIAPPQASVNSPAEEKKEEPSSIGRPSGRGSFRGRGGATGGASPGVLNRNLSIGGSQTSKLSVCSQFRNDLQKLVTTLAASERHYVRCIKPNDTKTPGQWDAPKVVDQLACNGVMETVELRKAGFANRIPFDVFLSKYSPVMEGLPETKEGLMEFFEKFDLAGKGTSWAIGNTKVYFRDHVLIALSQRLQDMFEKVCLVIQSKIRQIHAQAKLDHLRTLARCATIFQKFIRTANALVELDCLRKAYEEKVRCTTVLQRYVRGGNAKKVLFGLIEEYNAARILQKNIRRKISIARLNFLREQRRIKVNATTKLQSVIRRHTAIVRFLTLQFEKAERERLEREAQERERQRIAEEKRKAEEAERRRLEEEARRARLAAEKAERERLEEEARRARLAAEKAERERLAEEARLAKIEAEKAQKLAAEKAERERIEEEARQRQLAAERAKREEEEARKTAERERKEEEARQAKIAAEKSRAALQAKLAAEQAAEDAKKAAEKLKQERAAQEAKQIAEREAKKEILVQKAKEEVKLAGERAAAERKRLAEETQRKEAALLAQKEAERKTFTNSKVQEARRLEQQALQKQQEAVQKPVAPQASPVRAAVPGQPRPVQTPAAPAQAPAQRRPSQTQAPVTRRPSQAQAPVDQAVRARRPSQFSARAPAVQTTPQPQVLLDIDDAAVQELEAFFEPLGLSSLVDHFISEAVDLHTMLAWEDPRTEIRELGIPQRGVAFKIAKALEDYKKGEAKEEPSILNLALDSLFSSIVTQTPTPAPMPTPEPTLPPPKPQFEEQPGFPISLQFIRANLCASNELRSKLGRLSPEFQVFARTEAFFQNQHKYRAQTPNYKCPNGTILQPSFSTAEKGSPTTQMRIEEGWNIKIEVWEPGSFSNNLLGELVLRFSDINRLQNGLRWLPLHSPYTNKPIGEIEIHFKQLEHEVPILTLSQDSYLNSFECLRIPLLPDYEQQEPTASLIRLKSSKKTTCAILYIPSFSDYFWHQPIAHTFHDEGFQFYALEVRRYGRDQKANPCRPNYCLDLMEYYEELHHAINFMKTTQNINKIIILGQGFGAVLAALFASDHPGVLDGLILCSPFHTLSPQIAGFTPSLFSKAEDATKAVSLAYHQSLHKDHHGRWEWDLSLRPIEGWPIYVGWITAMQDAIVRLDAGLNIDCLTLILVSNRYTKLTDKFNQSLSNADAFLNPMRSKTLSSKWGQRVEFKVVNNALHDILLSEKQAEDQAYDFIFQTFGTLLDSN